VFVASVAGGGGVDVHGDARDPCGRFTGRHRGDDRVHLELSERRVGAGRILPEPGELGVDRGVDGGVAERIEREQRHVHTRWLVGPTLHVRLGTLAVEIAGLVARMVPRSDRRDSALRLAFELRHPVGGGRGHDVVGDRVEVGPFGIGQVAGEAGQRVEMVGRHSPGRQRVLQGWELVADALAVLDRLGFSPRAAALVHESVRGRLGSAVRVQLAQSSRAAHLGVIDPTLDPVEVP
jgi:hypothetical protein